VGSTDAVFPVLSNCDINNVAGDAMAITYPPNTGCYLMYAILCAKTSLALSLT